MVREPDDLENIVNEVIDVIGRRVKVSAAILFGSYALGQAGPYSDIDLAVFSSDVDDWSMEKRIEMAVDVRMKYPDVELHLFPLDALENARPSNFYGHILETGKRVA